jgi:hypothetical protein
MPLPCPKRACNVRNRVKTALRIENWKLRNASFRGGPVPCPILNSQSPDALLLLRLFLLLEENHLHRALLRLAEAFIQIARWR